MKPALYSSSGSIVNPTRDQIINVQDNFCNIRDADDIPIFEDYIDYLILNNLSKAEDWIARLKDVGSTHITLSISGDYTEDLGWAPRYPIPAIDWSNNFSGFKLILDWVMNKGMIPLIKLSLDGQSYDPGGNGVGWQWGIDNLTRVLPQLKQYFFACLWSTGFDGCYPDWTREQTIEMLRLLRSILGDKACIDTEFGNMYSHMGNGAGDWTEDQLGILDSFSVELVTFPPNIDGIQQVAARLLGPAKRNIDNPPNSNGKTNDGPYYLANLQKKINIGMYETCAYQAIRKQIINRDAIQIARQCAFYGFTSFGNGQP